MNKKVQLVGLSLLTAAFLSFNTGCKKPETTSTKPALHKLNGTLSITPAMENGMLSFKDAAEFDAYQEQLVDAGIELTNTPDANGETPTFDDALKQLEESIPNFLSLRAKNVNQFELENINGWDKAEDVPEKHKLSDPLLESALNVYGAVIIGNNIVMHLGADFTATIRKSETAIYSQLIEMPEAAKVDEVSAAKWVGNIDALGKIKFGIPSKSRLIIGSADGSNVTLGQWFSYMVNPRIEKDKCNPMAASLRPFTIVRNPNNLSVLVSGVYTINWGDGTSDNGYIVAGGSQNPISHTYASTGTYYPTLTASVTSTDGKAEVLPYAFDKYIVDGQGSCIDNTYREQRNQKQYSSDGNAYINCTLFFRSGLSNNFYAETEFYKKSGNRFRNVRTGNGKEICAKVFGTIATNSDCANAGSVDEEDKKNNRSSVKEIQRYTIFTPISTKNLRSDHYAFYNNEKIELSLEIPYCP